MDYGIEFGDRARCTGRDSDECVKLVTRIVKLAEIAATRGLLALENEPMESDPAALRIGVQLVVDGTEPDLVEAILGRFVLFGGHKGKELMIRVMTIEGVLALQRGDHPRVIEMELLAFLGERVVEAQAEAEDRSWGEGFENFLHDVGQTEATSEIPAEVTDQIIAMDDRSIQRILREVDPGRLPLILIWASGPAKASVFRNMSRKGAKLLAEKIRTIGDPDEAGVRESVEMLENLIGALRDQGEIA